VLVDREPRAAASNAGTPEWIDRVARDDQRLVRVLRLACAALANEKRALQQQLRDAQADLVDARAVAEVQREELDAAERQIAATAAAAASARAGAVGRIIQGHGHGVASAAAAGAGAVAAAASPGGTRSRSGSGAAVAGGDDDAMEQIMALNEKLHMDIFEQREAYEERLKAAEARRKDEATAAARARVALEAEVDCLKAALDQAQDAAARGVIEASDTDLARIVAARCDMLTAPAVRALDPIPPAQWWAGTLAAIDALLRPTLATEEPLRLLQQQVDILCQLALAAASSGGDRGAAKLARAGIALMRAVHLHASDIAGAIIVLSCAASSAVVPSAAGVAMARQQMAAMVDPLAGAIRDLTGDAATAAWEAACAAAVDGGLQQVFAALPVSGRATPLGAALPKLIAALSNVLRDPTLPVGIDPSAPGGGVDAFAPPYGRAGFDLLVAAAVGALRRSMLTTDAGHPLPGEPSAAPRIAPSVVAPPPASDTHATTLTLLRRAQAHADMLSAQRDMLLAERRDSALRIAAAQEAQQAATARYVAELHDKQDAIAALQQQVQVLSDALTDGN
jgi:hypothetical protein